MRCKCITTSTSYNQPVCVVWWETQNERFGHKGQATSLLLSLCTGGGDKSEGVAFPWSWGDLVSKAAK